MISLWTGVRNMDLVCYVLYREADSQKGVVTKYIQKVSTSSGGKEYIVTRCNQPIIAMRTCNVTPPMVGGRVLKKIILSMVSKYI